MRLPLLSVLSVTGLVSASKQIVPGAGWTALNINTHVQAHGGGMIEVDGVYYWMGENHLDGSAFQSINCYSSSDMVTWTFVNELLSVQTETGDLGPNRVVERPKIIFNDESKLFVMWMHIDDSSYAEAKAGVATSETVCGDYTYLGSSQPLGFQSRDMNLFKDTDGTAYLLTEDRLNGLRIDQLSSDYLSVESATFLYEEDYEAPAIFKDGDTYFMFASHESGWATNDNIFCTATDLAGPWSAWENFAPVGSDTYNSQTANVVSINGVILYMGDRWISTDLSSSTYIWLPLTLDGTSATLLDPASWEINMAAGTWSSGPSETFNEAEASSSILTNGAIPVTCSGCSGGIEIGWLGGPAAGTLTFPSVSSSVSTTTTIQIHHTNGDATQRFASVIVNGIGYVVAFLPTGGDFTPGTSVLTVPLKAGSNTIEFEGYMGGYAPNIDRLVVPTS